MSVEYMYVNAVCVIWVGRQAQLGEDSLRGAMGKVRFRFGPMVHGVILSSALFLITCISTLGQFPGDQESCGPVDLLSLAWPKGECQQSKSPISSSTYIALLQASWSLLHQVEWGSGAQDMVSLQWSSPSLP